MAAVPNGIDIGGTLSKILPGAASLAGLSGNKSSSQSSVSSAVNTATSVSPIIALGGTGLTTGSGGSASGSASTGQQYASLPDYLPTQNTGQYAGIRPNVGVTPAGVAYTGSNSMYLLLAGGAALLFFLMMGPKGK